MWSIVRARRKSPIGAAASGAWRFRSQVAILRLMSPVDLGRSWWIAAFMVAAAALCACNGYVKRGSALYSDGRYVEAAEVFERTEYRLGESTPRERAEYGLYRGMTLLVLGDVRNAESWLQYAYEVERRSPGALRAERRALLDRGWFELGQRRRASPPPATTTPSTAIAASQPPPAVAAPPPDGAPAPVKDESTLVPR
jgi:tetratricopeptide (TPR) repeat protein